jgi:hypothetical protein
MRHHKFELTCVGLLGLILAVSCVVPFITQDTVTFTVTDKERVNKGDSSVYLIFTETEVYKNSDCWVLGKFRSSEVYGNIEINQTYTARVYGFRIPIFSMYKNIVEVSKNDI